LAALNRAWTAFGRSKYSDDAGPVREVMSPILIVVLDIPGALAVSPLALVGVSPAEDVVGVAVDGGVLLLLDELQPLATNATTPAVRAILRS
jgi:hypothetical protein